MPEASSSVLHVYALRLLKLGDTWSGVSWLLQQQNVALSEHTRRRGSCNVRALVEEITSLLNTDDSITFVQGKSGGPLPEMQCYQHQYLPAKNLWNPNTSRRICVQFDGRWKAHRKNPREDEKMRFLQAAKECDYEIVTLGLPLTLTESVAALSNCHCFVGIDSGMMHVAHSVGCPRILVRNRMFQIDKVYCGKSLLTVRDLAEARVILFGTEEER